MSCSPSWEELLNGGVPKIRHIPEACERNTLSAFKCNMFHEASCSPALPGILRILLRNWSDNLRSAVLSIKRESQLELPVKGSSAWNLTLGLGLAVSPWLRAIYCQLGLSLWVAASWGCGTGSWRELDSRNRALEIGSHQIGLDQLTPANAPGVLEAYDAIIVDLQLVDEVPKVKVKCNVATPL